MVTATVDELKSNFDKYLIEIANGNDLTITKDGKEFATIKPSMYVLRDCLMKRLENGEYGKNIKDRRKLGIGKGKIKLSDKFDETFDSLDKNIEQMFGAL